jgi:hypothetical protein
MVRRKSAEEDVLKDHGTLNDVLAGRRSRSETLAGEEKGLQMGGHAAAGQEIGGQDMAPLPTIGGGRTDGVPAPTRVGSRVTATAARKKRPRAECGDLPFLIKRDGSWLYKGTVIGRKELVCLFASVLRREADGSYWLETPSERGRILVEDAPFLVVEMDWNGGGSEQVVTFRTNTDEIVAVDLDHPLRFNNAEGGDPKPYVRLRPGAGSHPIEARISRPVFYELVALAEPQPVRGKMMLGVWSSGVFFPLGEMPNDET